jgi:hypothetical protein
MLLLAVGRGRWNQRRWPTEAWQRTQEPSPRPRVISSTRSAWQRRQLASTTARLSGRARMRLGELAGGEGVGAAPAVGGLDHVLGDQAGRRVAVVAGGHAVVRRGGQPASSAGRDVAVGAGGRVVAEVGVALGVVEEVGAIPSATPTEAAASTNGMEEGVAAALRHGGLVGCAVPSQAPGQGKAARRCGISMGPVPPPRATGSAHGSTGSESAPMSRPASRALRAGDRALVRGEGRARGEAPGPR